uniref:Beta-defensin n=1 Tax=Urocitellus parryii TaxID=9999 RepID=A0A8D2ICT0_UROPR
MKSLLFTLAVSVLLTQLASGGWYVRKCANRTGNCRRTCRSGEVVTVPATGMCSKAKVCCLLVSQDCRPGQPSQTHTRPVTLTIQPQRVSELPTGTADTDGRARTPVGSFVVEPETLPGSQSQVMLVFPSPGAPR